jgi:protein-S-isoprenylcysteine O-methyltransferase Ste14
MRTLEPVKEFWTYTLLRIALFLGSAAIVYAVWALVADEVPVVWVVVIGFVLSGLGSYVILNQQREAFARRVDERARRATSKIEEMRSKEDAD